MEGTHHACDDPLVVLWTEDDDNDRMMIELALSRSGRTIKLMFVEDGEAAWHYLCGQADYSDRTRYPIPDVLVTDLKMPKCNGFELVERVRNDPVLKKLPIFVFTASDLSCDRRAAQEIGADGFITKPTGFGVWTTTVVGVLEQAVDRLHAA